MDSVLGSEDFHKRGAWEATSELPMRRTFLVVMTSANMRRQDIDDRQNLSQNAPIACQNIVYKDRFGFTISKNTRKSDAKFR